MIKVKVSPVSVKVMRSYDYCHFEISMTSTECESPGGADSNIIADHLRKECQRLADKAVEQYKVARKCERRIELLRDKRERMEARAERIRMKPETEWTPEEKAAIKALDDWDFAASRERYEEYDYEDDFEFGDDFDPYDDREHPF